MLEISERKRQNKKMKGPTDIASNQALRNPVKALNGNRGNHIVTHTSPVYTTAKANRRCFRQLDRQTDCFENGAIAAASGYRSTAHGEAKGSIRTDTANNLAAKVHTGPVGRYEDRSLVSPATILKAVCGTQTKQGGCLYEQPCSQI